MSIESHPCDPNPVEPRCDAAADPAGLSRALRIIGAILVVASAGTFMAQRWGVCHDALRYTMLLGQTLLVALAATFCARGVGDSRSARTFHGLVLASLPVHFTVLGGLLVSAFSLDPVGAAVPARALWIADSPMEALSVTALGLGVLGPLAYLALRGLDVARAGALTAALLALYGALLVPMRETTAAAWIACAAAAGSLRVVLDPGLAARALRGVSGSAVRALLCLPALLVVVRTLYLYEPDHVFYGAMLLAAAAVCFVVPPALARAEGAVQAAQGFAAALAFVGWCIVVAPLPVDEELIIPLLGLPYAAMLLLMGANCAGSGDGYRVLSALAAVLTAVVQLVLHGGLTASLLSLAVSTGVVAHGAWARRGGELWIGGLGLLVAVGYHVRLSIDVDRLTHWGSLCVLGVALILVATLVDRRAARRRPPVTAPADGGNQAA